MTDLQISKWTISTWIRFTLVMAAIFFCIESFAAAVKIPATIAGTSLAFGEDLSRRLTAIEGLNLEHRMTLVEANLDNIGFLCKGIMGGMIATLVERIWQITSTRGKHRA